MSKIIPMDLVKFMRGKLCGHSDIYFQKRGRHICTGKLCEKRDLSANPYSPDELNRQSKFRSAVSAVKSLTAEQKAAYAAEFQKQTKYATLRGYMMAQEYAKL